MLVFFLRNCTTLHASNQSRNQTAKNERLLCLFTTTTTTTTARHGDGPGPPPGRKKFGRCSTHFFFGNSGICYYKYEVIGRRRLLLLAY
jgi:hypothetical protein